MRALSAWLDRWMFERYTAAPAQLGVYRIAYSLFALLAVVPVAPWLRATPDAFFDPPVGLGALFTGFPAPGVLLVLNGAAVVLLALLLVGWRVPVVSVATSGVLLVLKSWEYSAGKVDHDILLVIAPLVLAGSGWGNALSLDAARAKEPAPERPRGAWPLALFAFITGVAISSAGALKLAFGWLDPSVHAVYRHLVYTNVGLGRSTWLADLVMRVDSAWLWKPADWAAVLLELSILPAAFHPRAFRTVLAVTTLFHLGVWLLFDIVFVPNVVAYGVFVTGTAALAARLPDRGPFRSWTLRAPAGAMAAAAAAAAGGVAVAAGRPLAELAHVPLDKIVVAAAAVVGAVYLWRSAAELWRTRARITAPATGPKRASAHRATESTATPANSASA